MNSVSPWKNIDISSKIPRYPPPFLFMHRVIATWRGWLKNKISLAFPLTRFCHVAKAVFSTLNGSSNMRHLIIIASRNEKCFVKVCSQYKRFFNGQSKDYSYHFNIWYSKWCKLTPQYFKNNYNAVTFVW